MSKIVIALGGNALGKTPEEQLELLEGVAKIIVSLVKEGNQIVLTHGNGPQVGQILLAMNYAVSDVINQINCDNCLTLVDGNKLIKNFNFKQKCIIKGDSKSASIAAASILAKVSRDRYMLKLHEEFPMYNWAKNAGYLTREHMNAIDKYGLTKYHRPSFLRKHFEQSKQLSLMQ